MDRAFPQAGMHQLDSAALTEELEPEPRTWSDIRKEALMKVETRTKQS